MLAVFAVLVLSTTPARASEPCACATGPVILPVPGAREVPRNTKIWVVGEALGRVRLDVTPRALAAARRHAVPTSIAKRR